MRILIVDDYPVVRHGVRQILVDAYPTAFIEEAENGEQALDLIQASPWDLVLLDIGLPGKSGMDCLHDIQHLRPEVPVLMFSCYSESQFAMPALRAGASGYLTKDRAPEDLLYAVQRIIDGGRYISADLAEQLAHKTIRYNSKQPHELLSKREFQVLIAIAAGKSINQIAADLVLSSKTVSTYRARILGKLHLSNNAEMTEYCLRHGLWYGSSGTAGGLVEPTTLPKRALAYQATFN
jgi:DNA-binding NarL/FixJ family response regulator